MKRKVCGLFKTSSVLNSKRSDFIEHKSLPKIMRCALRIVIQYSLFIVYLLRGTLFVEFIVEIRKVKFKNAEFLNYVNF